MNANFLNKIKNIQFRKPTRQELKVWLRKSPKYIGIGSLVGFVLLTMLYQAVRFEMFGEVPDMKELQSIQQHEASEVYSVDKVLLGRYFTTNRTTVEFRDINPVMLDALVAVEDKRFYEHNGIDFKSYARVIIKSILFQNKNTGGGSTITQQVAKNLYNRQRYGKLTMPVNKIREMIIALRLEKIYSKDEIITLYLNTVPFGENVFGLKIAARRFFNTTPKDLTTEQAATLAGMLQAPSRYNPRANPAKAEFRRNIVLGQMEKYGYLKSTQVKELSDIVMKTNYQFVSHSDGLAPYFRSHLKGELKNICKELKKPDGSSYNLYTDGLKIHTTIHSKWQRYAEEAANEHMAKLQKEFAQHWKNRTLWKKNDNVIVKAMKGSERYKKLKKFGWTEKEIERNFNALTQMDVFTWEGVQETRMTPIDSIIHYHSLLNVGFLATDPKSGEIRAWVGGIDHHFLQYDHVKAKRQAGSVFKPIVYTAALQVGYSPCSYFPNNKITYTEFQNWTPGNADGKYGGYYSLKGGLAKSVNTIAAQLIHQVGVDAVSDLAYRMGIQSVLPKGPAIALGTADLDLMELAQVYGTFANNGTKTALRYLIKIEDKNGKVLYTAPEPAAPEQVISPAIAYQINTMMQEVVDSGTARSLRFRYGFKGDICGKTGTTQNHADGRFMGFTPNLVAGAWVGGVNKKVRFRSLGLGNGGHMALPIWAGFYKRLLADPSYKNWDAAVFPQEDYYDDYNCKNFIVDELEIGAEQKPWLRNIGENLIDRIEDKLNGFDNEGGESAPNINEHPQRVRKTKPQKPKKKWLDRQKEKWKKRKER